MYDVFLSHNRQQKPWVREFCKLLRDGGLNVFFDEDSIKPGEDTVSAIEKAIESSRHVILVISPSSIASNWVALETAITVYNDPDASKGVLIPIILESVNPDQIKLTVRRLNRIDLTYPQTRDKQFQDLLRYLGLSQYVVASPPAWPKADATGIQTPSLFIADIENVISWGWEPAT